MPPYRALLLAASLSTATFGISPGALGQDASVDEATAKARSEFVRGAELVARADWAEALLAFERSDALKPHPVTTYNRAVCLRAMGQYARSRATFLAALDENDKANGELMPQ